jgi:UDP-glucose 4-epimerase
VSFRYFNACGADPQGRHGQEPGATHLIARYLEATRDDGNFRIYGDDYPTEDGTCIRDYIHIADIIEAFKLGIKYLKQNKTSQIINLGTENGFSTLQIFKKFQKFYKYKFKKPFFKKRRKGDTDNLICDNKKAYKILKWKPKRSYISKIINDEKKWLNYIENKGIYRKTIY